MGYKMLFDYYIKLKDKDGDKIVVDPLRDTEAEIKEMLNCSSAEAKKTLALLEQEYQVYSKPCQILLCKNEDVIFNFETYGMTWGTEERPHKYNELNEWDFRSFIDGKKLRTEKKTPKIKKIIVTSTETQIKRAKQLYFAKTIGFNITYKDYQRFYLMP